MHTLLIAAALLGNVDAFIRGELVSRGAKFTDIAITTPAGLPVKSEHFEITQIQYDPVHLKTYIRMRASDDPRKRSFEASVTGQILFPTLIAQRDVEFGAIVAASDFTVDYRPLSQLASPTARDLDGRKTRRKILAGEVVRPEMFSSIAVVEAGRVARYVVGGDGFSLSMPVVPLEGGTVGKTIRVRAPETGRIFKAVVAGPDQVKGEAR